MNIDLIEASPDDALVLENLLQLYSYDFSEILGTDVDDAGRFGFISIDYTWDDDRSHAFLVKVDSAYAGFAIVRRGAYLSGDPDVMDIDEFFVMRRYRRLGVGREVATRLFDRFPGQWEVREVAPNVAAQSFWRNVIDAYTNGRHDERVVDDERWRGPVQSFDTRARS